VVKRQRRGEFRHLQAVSAIEKLDLSRAGFRDQTEEVPVFPAYPDPSLG